MGCVYTNVNGNFMKRVLSYIYPIQLKKYNSSINGQIEVNLIDGKKTLDTCNSNYSYGSLQRILRYGLKKISFNEAINRILVLGLGGGSVIQTIREEFKSKAYIEAVDIDPKIIEIATKDFSIDRFENIKIVLSDAKEYLSNCKDSFDLIIVDIFVIDTIPIIFTQAEFIHSLKNHLNQKGYVIYNTMKLTMTTEIFSNIKSIFVEDNNFTLEVFNDVEGTNNLIVGKKNNR